MMLGIYTSVVTSSTKVATGSPSLALDDLMAVRKLNFPPAGSQFTPPHKLPGSFKFKDYAPAVFHSLRERFQVDQSQCVPCILCVPPEMYYGSGLSTARSPLPHRYLKSLGGAAEYIEFNSNSSAYCRPVVLPRCTEHGSLTPPPPRPPTHAPV